MHLCKTARHSWLSLKGRGALVGTPQSQLHDFKHVRKPRNVCITNGVACSTQIHLGFGIGDYIYIYIASISFKQITSEIITHVKTTISGRPTAGKEKTGRDLRAYRATAESK